VPLFRVFLKRGGLNIYYAKMQHRITISCGANIIQNNFECLDGPKTQKFLLLLWGLKRAMQATRPKFTGGMQKCNCIFGHSKYSYFSLDYNTCFFLTTKKQSLNVRGVQDQPVSKPLFRKISVFLYQIVFS